MTLRHVAHDRDKQHVTPPKAQQPETPQPTQSSQQVHPVALIQRLYTAHQELPLHPNAILSLQRTIGNRAVQRQLTQQAKSQSHTRLTDPIQPQVRVHPTSDTYAQASARGGFVQRKSDPKPDTADALIDVPVAWVVETPDPQAEPIAKLKKGDPIKVLGISGDFVKIVWQNGIAYVSRFDPALADGDWIVIVPDAQLAAGATPKIAPHGGQPDAAGPLVVFTSQSQTGPETHYQTDQSGTDVVVQGPLSQGVSADEVDAICQKVADARAKIHERYMQVNATGYWATPGTEKALAAGKGLTAAQNKEIADFQSRNANWAEGPQATAEYGKWLATALPTGVTDGKDPRWQIFQRVFPWEGNPSTINAYDRANVTWGVGFAPPAQVQSMIERVFAKSPEAKAAFLHAGITVDNNHQFLVVDPDKKWKLRGRDAELYIRGNRRLLSLLENVAQGVFQEEFQHRAASSPDPRQAVLDAQFETFVANALSGIPASLLNHPDLDFKALAAHSIHGLSGFYNWTDLAKLSTLKQLVQYIWDTGPSKPWFDAIVSNEKGWRSWPDTTKTCGWKTKEAEAAAKAAKAAAGQPTVARQADSDTLRGAETVLALGGGGEPVNEQLRRRVEEVTGADLAGVRVHTGAESARAARSLQAHAYTVGQEIHFAAGQYRPGTSDGAHLIAHELAHAAQQRGVVGQPGTLLAVSQPGDALEREADHIAEAATQGGIVPVSIAEPQLQRAKVIDANPDVGPFHPFDMEGANKFNAGRATKLDMAAIQYFLKVPLMLPREGYYFNKDKGGEKTAAKTAESAYPDPMERLRHFTQFPGERWVDIIEPITLATIEWQESWNAANPTTKLEENGKLDDATLKAFATKGYNVKQGKVTEDWTAVDRADFRAIRAEEAGSHKQVERGGGSGFAKRLAIVELAASQIGKVLSVDRGDGNKYGWERILRYYEVAYAGTNTPPTKDKPQGEPFFPSQFGDNTEDLADKKKTGPSLKQPVKDTMAAGKFSFPNPGGPWSWCAIFAVWAVRAATGVGRWDGKVNGLPFVADPKLKDAQRGDILYIISDNQHHCILAHEPEPDAPDGPYETIEGNLEGQEVRRCRRWTSANLHGYYRAVQDE